MKNARPRNVYWGFTVDSMSRASTVLEWEFYFRLDFNEELWHEQTICRLKFYLLIFTDIPNLPDENIIIYNKNLF